MLKITQNNRLSKLEGLECLVKLEELYVSCNGIKHIEGLETLVNSFPRSPILQIPIPPCPQVELKTLDVADNKIRRVQNVSHLLKLEEFWV